MHKFTFQISKGNIMNIRLKLLVFFLLAAGIAASQAAEQEQSPIQTTGNGTEFKPGVMDAVEKEMPVFKFGGFGSFGATHSSQSLGDYVLDGTVPKGAGRSSNWSAGNDSRIGVQATANFTPQVSAVLQVISEYQPDNTYHPGVEWANVKYAFSPENYIRAGRIALPTFMNSETRKVGYSYPWIHPPVDLYRVLSITNSDGIDARYRFEIGDAINSIKVIYGRNRNEHPNSISTSKDIWGIFDKFEYGAAIFRLAYQTRMASSLNLQTGVAGAWVQNSDLSAGAAYDTGDWFIMSEWIQRKSAAKLCAMYVSGGYRMDKLTPFLTYSNNGMDSFLPGYPPPTAAAIQQAKKSQSTASIGIRWDFMKNTDLKLQYDRVSLGDYSNGYLANVPPAVTLYGTRLHVVSAVIDFVF